MGRLCKTWFISDTHFGHNNIIKYCNRPFKNAENMNDTMIKNWNKVVGPHDIVYHLGDFAFGDKDYVTNIVSQLNGNIYLIRGNHDIYNNQWYRDCGFKEVYDYPIIIKDFIVLSHEPQPFVMNQMFVNLYGHIHASPMFNTWGDNCACMCVERHNYTPVDFENIVAHLT